MRHAPPAGCSQAFASAGPSEITTEPVERVAGTSRRRLLAGNPVHMNVATGHVTGAYSLTGTALAFSAGVAMVVSREALL